MQRQRRRGGPGGSRETVQGLVWQQEDERGGETQGLLSVEKLSSETTGEARV